MNHTRSCGVVSALLAAVAFSTPCGAVQAGEVLRILPLGDSITQAVAERASYRYPLWRKLVDSGLAFDFVGSMQKHLDLHGGGTPPQPDYKGRSFDRDHEGHFGWTADEIINGRAFGNGSGTGRLAGWMQGYDADIALVHLGTNDVFSDESVESTADELKEIIRILRRDNPAVAILLAKLIPVERASDAPGPIESLNEMIPQVAKAMHTDRSPVIVVDQYTGFDPAADTYDGVHPNESGEKKMAQRWFDAIMAVTDL